IPGLNAPPPPGAAWGFHPGGYGKPPVDEHNRPLYGGDIFGVLQTQQNMQHGEPVEKDLWGELQPPEEESEEEEESDEEEEEEESDEEGAAGRRRGEGAEEEIGDEDIGARSGMTSVAPEGFVEESIAGDLDLRKARRGGTETEEAPHRAAHTVVPEQRTSIRGFFGGERVYDLKSAQAQAQAEQEKQRNLRVLGREEEDEGTTRKRKVGDVDVALDPETMSKEALREAYEANRGAAAGEVHNPDWSFQEDLSDMIASESRKRLKKEEERRGGGGEASLEEDC
ncbi:RNA-splicing factor, partial [Ascosphaera pollenicola]